MSDLNLECVSPGAQGLLGLRIGGLFGILAMSSLGVTVPYFTYNAYKSTGIYFLLRAFASGVVLTTGYVHVLGDAFPILTDPCLGLSTTYPWAMTFATAASLFTFTMEWCLRQKLQQTLKRKAIEAAPGKDMPGPDDAMVDPAAVKEAIRVENTVIAYTFEAGIVFHSIFIGITLGISSNASTVTALMIALLFHQGNEGLALGVLFVKAEYSFIKYLICALTFIVITPIGVAIGISLNSSWNGSSKAALGSEGIFDSVSAGILIYNGLVDLIVPTFADKEMPKSNIMRFLGFCSLWLGAGIMALIGKWA